MKNTFTLFLLVVIVFACSRKTITTTVAETKHQVPLAEKADGIIETPLMEDQPISSEHIKKDASQNDALVAGQRVYTINCGRCHELHSVEKFTAQRWDEILKKMIPKAKLNAEQSKQVTAYVLANVKK